MGRESCCRAAASSHGVAGQAAQDEEEVQGVCGGGGGDKLPKRQLRVFVCAGGGEGGKLPRMQDKPVYRVRYVFICTHCSLIHARVHVHFSS